MKLYNVINQRKISVSRGNVKPPVTPLQNKHKDEMRTSFNKIYILTQKPSFREKYIILENRFLKIIRQFS